MAGPDDAWWEEMLYQESYYEFAEQEMSYEDAMAEGQPEDYVATDEGGWGAWLDGEQQ